MNESHHAEAVTEARRQCPNCESFNIRVEPREDRFMYGVGSQATELTAIVPMHSCRDCGLEYTDEEGEIQRHAAVCKHLGILPPSEITAIRLRYGLSRRQFAAVTKIGLATLSRWEAGEGTQNAAMDIYMRLLSRREVFDLVANENAAPRDSSGPAAVLNPAQPREIAVTEKFAAIAKFDPSRRARLVERRNLFKIEKATATG